MASELFEEGRQAVNLVGPCSRIIAWLTACPLLGAGRVNFANTAAKSSVKEPRRSNQTPFGTDDEASQCCKLRLNLKDDPASTRHLAGTVCKVGVEIAAGGCCNKYVSAGVNRYATRELKVTGAGSPTSKRGDVSAIA